MTQPAVGEMPVVQLNPDHLGRAFELQLPDSQRAIGFRLGGYERTTRDGSIEYHLFTDMQTRIVVKEPERSLLRWPLPPPPPATPPQAAPVQQQHSGWYRGPVAQ